MSSNNSEKYFILSVLFALYIIISYFVFVVVRIGTGDSMFAALCFGVIAVLLCGGTLHIYCKLNSMVPKSDRKRIKHETADKAEPEVDEEV